MGGKRSSPSAELRSSQRGKSVTIDRQFKTSQPPFGIATFYQRGLSR